MAVHAPGLLKDSSLGLTRTTSPKSTLVSISIDTLLLFKIELTIALVAIFEVAVEAAVHGAEDTPYQ